MSCAYGHRHREWSSRSAVIEIGSGHRQDTAHQHEHDMNLPVRARLALISACPEHDIVLEQMLWGQQQATKHS